MYLFRVIRHLLKTRKIGAVLLFLAAVLLSAAVAGGVVFLFTKTAFAFLWGLLIETVIAVLFSSPLGEILESAFYSDLKVPLPSGSIIAAFNEVQRELLPVHADFGKMVLYLTKADMPLNATVLGRKTLLVNEKYNNCDYDIQKGILLTCMTSALSNYGYGDTVAVAVNIPLLLAVEALSLVYTVAGRLISFLQPFYEWADNLKVTAVGKWILLCSRHFSAWMPDDDDYEIVGEILERYKDDFDRVPDSV